VIRASRDWARTLTITFGQSSGTSRNLTVGRQWGSSRQGIEDALRQDYSISSENRETHAEEITIQVPAGSSVQLILRWKQIMQHGIVRLDDGNGSVAEIPSQVVTAITFDQVQRQLALALPGPSLSPRPRQRHMKVAVPAWESDRSWSMDPAVQATS
jgi:hypothetical protein